MDDQLDKDLSKRIKEVFDNYEDTSADAGWLELRKKFPEEKERRGLAWLWPRVVAAYAGYGSYQRRTERDIPLVICEPR